MSLHNIPPTILFVSGSIKDVWEAWQNKLNSYSMRAGQSRTEKDIIRIKNRIDRTGSREKLTILNRIKTLNNQLLGMYKQGVKMADAKNFGENKKPIFNLAKRIGDVEDDIFKLKRRLYVYRV